MGYLNTFLKKARSASLRGMRIALIGYGRMGKEVEKSALSRGHIITSKEEADVWIDFSHPEGILERVEEAIRLYKPFVIGTTGWDPDEAKRLILARGGALFFAPNFSLGVNFFLKIVREAYRILTPLKLYDVAGHEIHHNMKLDSPSGTAKLLSTIIGKEFSSSRVGHVPGTHTITFDSPCDTITLTHEARSREGFALGSVIAAEWLIGKKGYFTMDDLMETYD